MPQCVRFFSDGPPSGTLEEKHQKWTQSCQRYQGPSVTNGQRLSNIAYVHQKHAPEKTKSKKAKGEMLKGGVSKREEHKEVRGWT